VYDGRDDDEDDDDGDAPPNDGWMMRLLWRADCGCNKFFLCEFNYPSPRIFFQTLSKPIISFHLEFLF